MRAQVFSVAAACLLTAACGSNTTQRAASGGLTGAAVGAIVGGPVGALAGAGVGAAGGWAMPEGADTLALNAIGKEKQVASSGLEKVGLGPTAQGSSSARMTGYAGTSTASLPPHEIKQMQARLQRDGLYTGPVDGIFGPKTQEAMQIWQREHNMPQTAQLDRQTMDAVLSDTASGSSTPPEQRSSENPPEQQTH